MPDNVNWLFGRAELKAILRDIRAFFADQAIANAGDRELFQRLHRYMFAAEEAALRLAMAEAEEDDGK